MVMITIAGTLELRRLERFIMSVVYEARLGGYVSYVVLVTLVLMAGTSRGISFQTSLDESG